MTPTLRHHLHLAGTAPAHARQAPTDESAAEHMAIAAEEIEKALGVVRGTPTGGVDVAAVREAADPASGKQYEPAPWEWRFSDFGNGDGSGYGVIYDARNSAVILDVPEDIGSRICAAVNVIPTALTEIESLRDQLAAANMAHTRLRAAYGILEGERDEFRGRVVELEAALAPFARHAALYVPQAPNDAPILRDARYPLTIGDVRTALTTLTPKATP